MKTFKTSTAARWFQQLNEKIDEAIEDLTDDLEDSEKGLELLEKRKNEFKEIRQELEKTEEKNLISSDYLSSIQNRITEIWERPINASDEINTFVPAQK